MPLLHQGLRVAAVGIGLEKLCSLTLSGFCFRQIEPRPERWLDADVGKSGARKAQGSTVQLGEALLLEGETHDGDPVRIAAHDLSEATKGKQNVLEGIQGELLRNGALCHWQICYVLRALLRLP